MIAQHRSIRDEEGMSEIVRVDLMAFMKHFMALARRVLKPRSGKVSMMSNSMRISLMRSSLSLRICLLPITMS